MILNNSKLRLLALVLVLSSTLSACSSLPSLPSLSGDDSDKTEDAQTTETSPAEASDGVENADANEGETAPEPLTPEQLEEQALAAKAQNLIGTLNAFKLDKQQQTKLNSSQLRDVQTALDELANEAPDKALEAVQRVINDPDFIASPNSAVWVLRGDIYRASKENDKAISNYQTALKIVASNYQAHNRLGLIYRDKGKFDLAKSHYTQAIEAWPGNADSYRNRGILFDLYVGDKTAALEDYKIYKALLDFQIKSVESPAKSLLKEQKLARQWILDIERQIKRLQREKANG
ncbi:MAG: tetratricopeptide (TPR) repeat protein [Glaciecola sp.]|jgi:tetratricopeptide (TPR) repeat protein